MTIRNLRKCSMFVREGDGSEPFKILNMKKILPIFFFFFHFIAGAAVVYHGSHLDSPTRSPLLLPQSPWKKASVLLLLERKRKRQSGAQTKSPFLVARQGEAGRTAGWRQEKAFLIFVTPVNKMIKSKISISVV